MSSLFVALFILLLVPISLFIVKQLAAFFIGSAAIWEPTDVLDDEYPVSSLVQKPSEASNEAHVKRTRWWSLGVRPQAALKESGGGRTLAA